MPAETEKTTDRADNETIEGTLIPGLGDAPDADAALAKFVSVTLPELIKLDQYRRGIALDMLSHVDERPRRPHWSKSFAKMLAEVLPGALAAMTRTDCFPPIAPQKPEPEGYDVTIEPKRLAVLVQLYGRDLVASVVRDLGYDPDSFDELKTIVTPPPPPPDEP